MSSTDEPIKTEMETTTPPRRLCSEIQLFDLCELERCRFKDGRFCTEPDLLARFEAVAEPQDRPAPRFVDNDGDDDDELYPEECDEDDDGYSDFDDEDRQEQGEEW
jgi:hypothetical protein